MYVSIPCAFFLTRVSPDVGSSPITTEPQDTYPRHCPTQARRNGHVVRLRNTPPTHCTTTITMDEIGKDLDSAVKKLSDDNYEQSLAIFRGWFGTQTHRQVPPDQIFNVIWDNRRMGSMNLDLSSGELIHPTVHLIVRFASDIESDHFLAPHSSGLQSRLCAGTLQGFLTGDLADARGGERGSLCANFCTDANLIAHWVNLGCVEEPMVRNRILQSFASRQALDDHQAFALITLFKLAGATFEAYVDTPVVDRCFELLKDYLLRDPERGRTTPPWVKLEDTKQVRGPPC